MASVVVVKSTLLNVVEPLKLWPINRFWAIDHLYVNGPVPPTTVESNLKGSKRFLSILTFNTIDVGVGR